MTAKKTTTKAAPATRSEETSDGFTVEERAAMKERAKEVRDQARWSLSQGTTGRRGARQDRRDGGRRTGRWRSACTPSS